jgi:hypothetical protein
MTSQEIKLRRDDFQAKLQNAIRSVEGAWKRSNFLYYVIRTVTLLLAAIVAFEPLLRDYIHPKLFWDVCAFLVLISLLFDLGLRPGETLRGHANYLSRARRLEQEVALVDPEDSNALSRLSEINNKLEIVEEKHREETR